jgi:hypothetical protein
MMGSVGHSQARTSTNQVIGPLAGAVVVVVAFILKFGEVWCQFNVVKSSSYKTVTMESFYWKMLAGILFWRGDPDGGQTRYLSRTHSGERTRAFGLFQVVSTKPNRRESSMTIIRCKALSIF